ncbi:hypothetical protein H4R20_002276 [Coemansia guatemalensis]|uniref:Uncharacterized protein n=1 Tax=Coemansia guatemalensis TaxID=2761395 RepID=A0A9W8I1R4_9FUNG|nr:hypothetical protein H4R20_002276 [Coemansia guatemalensis]
MKVLHQDRCMQIDPQVCVCAATAPNQPTALDHASSGSREEHRRRAKLIDSHYKIEGGNFVEPSHHPNAGIGGYQEVQRKSDIGGYYDINRESEIGNDHSFGSRYWAKRMLHKVCHPLEKDAKAKQ